MGDVAMLSPVIHSLLQKNPALSITVLSRPAFEPLFGKHERLQFFGADLKNKYNGIGGLLKLYKESKSSKFDAIVDVHDVLRSRILGLFFSTSGHKLVRFDKGRNEKKAITAKNKKNTIPLKHTTQRYFECFSSLGLSTGWSENPLPELGLKTESTETLIKEKSTANKWIGVAPFARHESKIWGIKKIEEVITILSQNPNFRFLLFGGGTEEITQLKKLQARIKNTILIAGNYSLEEELEIMRHLDLMISMDSANMHMAALSNCKVVSIWGPTHPSVGFAALFNDKGIVQADISCRPCSTFGAVKSTWQKDCAKKSMEAITPQMVVEKVKALLQS